MKPNEASTRDEPGECFGVIAEFDDHEALLTRTVGLEDAPESVIKKDQDLVRKAAIDTGEHGLVKNTGNSHSS